MPAGKGGAPRKGQLGKKAQLEKMVEASKKAPSTPTKPQNAPPKKANGSKKVLDSSVKSLHISTQTDPTASIQDKYPARARDIRLKVGNGNIVMLNQLPKAADVQAESIPCLEDIHDGTATVRLPGQPLKFFPAKRVIVYVQPARPKIPVPTTYRNPNRVILHLPGSPKPKVTTFLSLAQELRNQIYGLALPRDKYRIQWIPRDDQRPTELTYTLPLRDHKGPHLTAKAGKLRRDFDLPKRNFVEKDMPRYHLSPGPAALLLVSKQVYQDTAPMFYGRNTFSFTAMKPLGRFLDSLRPETRSMLRSLELIHTTASNAELIDNQIWKRKHDRRWESLCFQIRSQCNYLEDLTLDLYIKDLPFKLGPHAVWMSPLYAFMGLKHLKHIDVRLHQAEADDAVLEVEAYTVRKALMCENFYEPVFSTGNKPILQKPSPRKARPGINALRVTIGDRRVPAACIKPSLGPRATTFWTPPTPTASSEQSKEKVAINATNRKDKGKDGIKTLLTWTPPATLIGTAIRSDNTVEGKAFRNFGALINSSLKRNGKAAGAVIARAKAAPNACTAIKSDDKGKAKAFHPADTFPKNIYKKKRKPVSQQAVGA
ncbi:MAG: hypothetical protein Q9213_006145 [Squamulea squamosa]